MSSSTQIDSNSSKSNIIEEEEEEDDDDEPGELNCSHKPSMSSLNPHSLACKVASLSSLTSNYSQLDFKQSRRHHHISKKSS